jgi:hypothetical protein
MGKKQRDCADCGAPVGFLGRELCCLFVRRAKKAAAKTCCPQCSKDRVLLAATGKCVLCSRRCSRCRGPVRAVGADLCRGCLRRAEREAAKSLCPRCSKAGFLREATGLCGSCSRPGPPKGPPRICWVCGELRRHSGLGMCSRCWQRHPDRPFVKAQNLAARLNQPPAWLPNFAAHLSASNSVGRACVMITALGRLLDDGQPQHPQALLERARRPGRSSRIAAKRGRPHPECRAQCWASYFSTCWEMFTLANRIRPANETAGIDPLSKPTNPRVNRPKTIQQMPNNMKRAAPMRIFLL